ncbi:hypothetical protein ACIO3S_24495 [Nocardioides sp. NPDC087217]|uniref:hypothetical protein n=1 Tax=Nocardioides sp. NPDC087217 TaxID=3364335 RepID=UPI003816845A
MSTIQTTEPTGQPAEPHWIHIAGRDRYLGTGPVYVAEADRDGTHFTAWITRGNSTTTLAAGYQLDVASNTGPGWSTHAEALAEAQADFATYLRATPEDHDVDLADQVDEHNNTTKEIDR